MPRRKAVILSLYNFIQLLRPKLCPAAPEMVEVDDKLAAWNVKEENYPSNKSIEEKLRFLLRYAVLAPSGPNTQPWKVHLRGNEVMLMADFSRSLPSVDSNNRLSL